MEFMLNGTFEHSIPSRSLNQQLPPEKITISATMTTTKITAASVQEKLLEADAASAQALPMLTPDVMIPPPGPEPAARLCRPANRHLKPSSPV